MLGFPLLRYSRAYVCKNKIEAMYGRSRATYVKVEPRSFFRFTRELAYIASILYLPAYVRKN